MFVCAAKGLDTLERLPLKLPVSCNPSGRLKGSLSKGPARAACRASWCHHLLSCRVADVALLHGTRAQLMSTMLCFITSTASLQDKVDNVGLEVERKGLKASEKSDHNVRKAYDNSHKPREDIKDAAKEAKHKGKEVGRGVIAAPHRVPVTEKLGRRCPAHCLGARHPASN